MAKFYKFNDILALVEAGEKRCDSIRGSSAVHQQETNVGHKFQRETRVAYLDSRHPLTYPWGPPVGIGIFGFVDKNLNKVWPPEPTGKTLSTWGVTKEKPIILSIFYNTTDLDQSIKDSLNQANISFSDLEDMGIACAGLSADEAMDIVHALKDTIALEEDTVSDIQLELQDIQAKQVVTPRWSKFTGSHLFTEYSESANPNLKDGWAVDEDGNQTASFAYDYYHEDPNKRCTISLSANKTSEHEGNRLTDLSFRMILGAAFQVSLSDYLTNITHKKHSLRGLTDTKFIRIRGLAPKEAADFLTKIKDVIHLDDATLNEITELCRQYSPAARAESGDSRFFTSSSDESVSGSESDEDVEAQAEHEEGSWVSTNR